MTLRALVFGSGWGSHGAHELSSDARVVLGGIVSRGSARSRALARALETESWVDSGAAIRSVQPQIAIVSVGERSHPAIVAQLFEAGCHVLCSHPVAETPEEVRTLARLAGEAGLLASVDYSLRTTDVFRAARRLLESSGALLRLSMQCPGRAMVIAIDLALALAGPARRVFAAGAYPAVLAERRAARSTSFPPTLVLEHHGGCVTVVTPVPHADPRSAHRISVSTEARRIDLALPRGELVTTSVRSSKAVEHRVLLLPGPSQASNSEFEAPMRRTVNAFVDAASGLATSQASFDDEARVRDVWLASQRASRTGAWVDCAFVDPE